MEHREPLLVIIDGYSLLFRAHLAYGGAESLRTRDGRPTGAIHGFTSMLLSILKERPDAVYVAWDAPGPTFRDELFPQYKAQRPEADPDLKAQFGPAREMVDAFGIPSVEVPGYEADDLVGSLAERAREQGYRVCIVTGDTDQLQLVRDGVTVRMTGRGVSETVDYDHQRVLEKYGVRPDQMADFKALVGDPSDNIPGVPGVGKVTAARLLQQWGSLESILEHVDELPERTATDRKIKAALKEGADQVRLARTLTQIRTDVAIPLPLTNYEPGEDTWEAVRERFRDLEFRTLAQRLSVVGASAASEPPPAASAIRERRYGRIGSRAELAGVLETARRCGSVALVLQTDGASPLDAEWLGLGLATDEECWYVPIRKRAGGGEQPSLFAETDETFAATPEDVRELFCGNDVSRAGHEVKAMLEVLRRHGLGDASFDFDTAIAAYLLRPGSGGYELRKLAERYLGNTPAEGASADDSCALDAGLIADLRHVLQARLEADGLKGIFEDLEMPLAPVLADMELLGVLVDRAWLDQLSAEIGRQVLTLEEEIYRQAGERFLISSTQQLQKVLFDKLGLPEGRRTKTGRSTSADHLEALAADYPIARLILQYREATKLKSTYADALPRLVRKDTGRLHTTFHQTVTATGRLSSSDPNLQNIPVRSEEGRKIRRAFVAPPGSVLLSCDYSQIELRVFAHVTEDPELLRAFEADEDIHSATAMKLFGVSQEGVSPEMRRRAKTVNFAVIYGQSAYGLAQTLGIPVEEAAAFIRSYFEQFPGVRVWTQAILEQARARGYVETLLGRRRYLPDLRAGNRNVREAAERAAVNMPIQGTAADIMKLAMLAVQRDIQSQGRPWRLVLQVHDELLFEAGADAVGEAAAVVRRLMSGAFSLRVPLKVDAKAGPNWAEMEPVPQER